MTDPTSAVPSRQGLYDPQFESDACGVGFIANIHGERSHRLVDKSLELLVNLWHRGAAGADPETGDGAGILTQVPWRFLARQAASLGIVLPGEGRWTAGNVFLSPDPDVARPQQRLMEAVVAERNLLTLGWRQLPTQPSAIGRLARGSMPSVWQIFVGLPDEAPERDALDFERQLYILRRMADRRVKAARPGCIFHIVSLSVRKMVYKGLLHAHQIEPFYPDLSDPDFDSALAIVHQRYSTNTFPTWNLAQPFRFLAHNGEINTLRGNLNWMKARERSLANELFGDDLQHVLPLLDAGRSDSAQFDATLELLVLSGRSLAHAMCMMIPEAWEHHAQMSPELRAFYEYHALLMEPWDGPASIVFTDGVQIGAVLDRNGLRPLRYVVTEGGFIVGASEVGVIAFKDEDIVQKGRLQPGRMLLVDTAQHRIIGDDEVKGSLVASAPWRQWMDTHRIHLDALPLPSTPDPLPPRDLTQQIAFGYTLEDLKLILSPMVEHGTEAIGSMGDDTALACLSDRPRLLFEYFKQHFAQVTNPAIDSMRERLVMSLFATLDASANLLSQTPEHARAIRLDSPLLRPRDFARITHLQRDGFEVRTFATLFAIAPNAPPDEAGAAMEGALTALLAEVRDAVEAGVNIVILSDRGVDAGHAPIPSLLATAAVHHHLVAEGIRTRCALVVDTGEAREIGHFALLIGYGAAAIYPYLAWQTIADLIADGLWFEEAIAWDDAVAHYRKAVDKGLLKIFAKMGISTAQSYQSSQLFEAIGLSDVVVQRYFTGTPSRISGVGLDVIARETVVRHSRAFHPPAGGMVELDPGGLYQWRRRGERHNYDPDVVAALQHAVREESFGTYAEFSRLANKTAEESCTLRGLLEFVPAEMALPLEEVEPASAIVRRFCTGAMSYGSISREAHETLARAMNQLGGRSNTGEGGEDPARFEDDRRSAIKQVASGRFGVTSWYLTNADELQIKIAQGAKPGEGGQLPGHKVDAIIAKLRHSTPGVALISPPPHHDIYSIEDLSQLIHDLKCANPRANISVKLVARGGVGTIAAGVAKGKADGIVISGHDGGTGASPQTSLKYAGVPWEIGLAETQQTLVLNHLRGRIRLQVDGGLKTGRDVAIAALLGADEFGFSTAPLVAMGCILMRVCHLNTCPVGVATQNPELRKLFAGLPEHVVHYMMFVAEETRQIMARLGFRTIDEMVGRTDKLRVLGADEFSHWKAQRLDYTALLHRPDSDAPRRHCEVQDHGLDKKLDHTLIARAEPALERGEPVVIDLTVRNVHRTLGTMLGHAVSLRYGADGLPDDTITLKLVGTGGQSLGAFAPRGITFDLEGDANDYVGKGLSGARIIVRPPKDSTFPPEANVIVGNVVLYGATSGEVFLNGLAGERFAVRNSGATAVVEGVGDHACEYMTGGRVLILGRTGRNFAAGMSGGIAWVYDGDGDFAPRCNKGMVLLESAQDDLDEIYRLLTRHVAATGSPLGARLLDDWVAASARFVRVIPAEYKRTLQPPQPEHRGSDHG